MSSAISVPVIIAISSVAGVIVIASTSVVIFLAVRRKRQNNANNLQHPIRSIQQNEEHIDTRSSYEIGELSSSKQKLRPLLKAFSEKTLKAPTKAASYEPPRMRHVLQRKRYAEGRSTSLPVFSIVAPRIPSPTISLGKQSELFHDRETYALTPIASSNPATAGGSYPSLSDQWPLPPSGTGHSQSDPLQPAPLFHRHSRSLSCNFTPSVHPPRSSSSSKPTWPIPPPTRSEDYPTMKRFMSLQQIGRAPTGALPTPPPGYISLLHSSNPRIARSRSPGTQSIESFISGTSSILRSASSPVSGRKRGTTEARAEAGSGIINDRLGPVVLHESPVDPRQRTLRTGRQFASRSPTRSSRILRHASYKQTLDKGSGDGTPLPRNKSSGLSVGLINASIPQETGASEGQLSPSRRRQPESPPVLNPSPRRIVRGYRLLQNAELASKAAAAATAKHSVEKQADQSNRDPFTSKDQGYMSSLRSAKPFISHLPRSPRPEDRPVGVHLAPRSHTSSRRGSPIQRVLPPGVESGELKASHSQASLQSNQSQSRLAPNQLLKPIGSQSLEPIACGDLASHLRRMDSYCEADDDAGYFNLTGGTYLSPRDGVSARPNKSPLHDSVRQDSSSCSPARGQSSGTSGFYTPVSLPGEHLANPSSPPSLEQDPGLTPHLSSSPPMDEPWYGSSPASVGGLGLGLAGRFDITANGLSFSPAPSPCPSPPPRSTLRNTLLVGSCHALSSDALSESSTSHYRKSGTGSARELGVVDGTDNSSATQGHEDPWGFRGLRVAREAEERSAKSSRDMGQSTERRRVVLQVTGSPVARREQRSMRASSPQGTPGMAF